jgi:hypothetical protein
LAKTPDGPQLGFERGFKSTKKEILEIIIHGKFRLQDEKSLADSGRSVNKKTTDRLFSFSSQLQNQKNYPVVKIKM